MLVQSAAKDVQGEGLTPGHPYPWEEDFDLLGDKVKEVTDHLNNDLRGCNIWLVSAKQRGGWGQRPTSQLGCGYMAGAGMGGQQLPAAPLLWPCGCGSTPHLHMHVHMRVADARPPAQACGLCLPQPGAPSRGVRAPSLT